MSLFGKKNKDLTAQLFKLQQCIQIWRQGGEITGLPRPDAESIYALINISNRISTTVKAKPEIKQVLDYCEIPYTDNNTSILVKF